MWVGRTYNSPHLRTWNGTVHCMILLNAKDELINMVTLEQWTCVWPLWHASTDGSFSDPAKLRRKLKMVHMLSHRKEMAHNLQARYFYTIISICFWQHKWKGGGGGNSSDPPQSIYASPPNSPGRTEEKVCIVTEEIKKEVLKGITVLATDIRQCITKAMGSANTLVTA